MQQGFNIEQQNYAIQSLKDTKTTASLIIIFYLDNELSQRFIGIQELL